MIHAYPELESKDRDVLEMIRGQRRALHHQVNINPVRWTGFLRRNTFARAIQGSNSIEGYNATLAEAVAIVDNERPETLDEESSRALQAYRVAMTYIISVHNDPGLEINPQFLRGLHFMMLNYDMTKFPGQWRPGNILVVREPDHEVVHEGPDSTLVPELMQELCLQAHAADAVESATVLGALAHLNLAMIHPFKDGNGRMARALQTLVIARNGMIAPEFSSIEEWLGRNSEAYYAVLGETGQGKWNPQRSALPWVRFCLVAHYQQAATILRRNETIGRVWSEIETLRKRLALPERCELPLVDAAFGYKVRNSKYREDAGVSDVVASRDLKTLVDQSLLQPHGEKRGRHYTAAVQLRSLMDRLSDRRRPGNPYELLSGSVAEKVFPLSG